MRMEEELLQEAAQIVATSSYTPEAKKPPLLLYRERDLHNVDVLEDFLAEYGPIYYNLFAKYLG